MSKSIEFQTFAEPQALAIQIAHEWTRLKQARSKWEEEKKEIREYIFARDTSTTSNSQLPWKNKTTVPKLCQIRDNLHANYMAAIFSREEWFQWMAMDEDSSTKDKAEAITNYVAAKARASDLVNTVSDLLLDYIDTGNAHAEVVHCAKYHTLPDGSKVKIYVGPKVQRISAFDHVFDLTAPTYDDATKITRSVYGLGDLKKRGDAGEEWAAKAYAEASEIRRRYSELGSPDIKKYSGLAQEGLGSITDYYKGTLVEVLEFEGDAFDSDTGTLYSGHKIIVVDRRKVVHNAPFESWLGRSNKKHVGWRTRPETLLAMGPLDNLVGMQYRIDHLENLKADIFDQIAHPVVYQKGTVEDWEWGPGERIYGDTESDVSVLRPDSVALNADFQIQRLMDLMEEMAGAPKQAMGIRTPGEKTAYEVQTLENAAGRVFQNKISHFERVFLEPLLNDMLECGRRKMDAYEAVPVPDTDLGVVEFRKVTPEDIKASGKLVPMGSRHFAEVANQVQTLNAFIASPAYQDQTLVAHISGRALAAHFAELLKLPKDAVQTGVRVIEQAQLAQLAQAGQAAVQDSALAGQQIAQADAEIPPDDVE